MAKEVPLQFGATVNRTGADGDFMFHGFARDAKTGEFDTASAKIERDGKCETVPTASLKAKQQPQPAAPAATAKEPAK